MSTFSSICHDDEHKDQIDIAISFVYEQIRIYVWKDADGKESTLYLNIDETKHVLDLIDKAIKKIERSNK